MEFDFDERKLLPVIRAPFAYQEEFKNLFLPVYQTFLDSNLAEADYGGYALSLHFMRSSSSNFNEVLTCRDKDRQCDVLGWKISVSTKDKNDSIWSYGDTLVVTHLFSFLWFNDPFGGYLF